MDLNTIAEIVRPTDAEAYTWLAGRTGLFSEAQISTHTRIDVEGFNWPSLTVSPEGLEIAATCKVLELDRFTAPFEWKAAELFQKCCRVFLASFKIWNEATVGGNIVMSLPASPMISLTAALEVVCKLWPRDGVPREVTVTDFVTGNRANVLAPGELLRSIFLPASALKKDYAFRRFTSTHLRRSDAPLIGTRCPERGEFLLTVTAATLRPVQLRFKQVPSAEVLRTALDRAAPFDLYLDDVYRAPGHRQHLTYFFAEQIREELSF